MTLWLSSWMAIGILSVSYWFQIYRIHKHKEVRDLSLTYHILLALGFGMLAITAVIEGSTIFLTKQVLTTVPVLIIIGQILYHRDDHWHDDEDEDCAGCGEELEPHWAHCPYCGEASRTTGA